jgi:hypothetical protein
MDLALSRRCILAPLLTQSLALASPPASLALSPGLGSPHIHDPSRRSLQVLSGNPAPTEMNFNENNVLHVQYHE